MKRLFAKRRLNGKFRVAILLLLFLQLAWSSYLLYRAYGSPETVVNEVTLASYAQTGNLDYSVSLRPNTLYDNASQLGPGMSYFSKLASSVDTVFYYDLSGSGIGPVNGTYRLVASLGADTWEKNYTVVPATPFSGEGGASFQIPFSVNLTRYNELVTSISNEVGVPAKDSSLKLVYAVDSVSVAGGREVRNSLSPVVVIPLGRASFGVAGDIFVQRSGSVKDTEAYVQREVLEDRIHYRNTSLLLLVILAFFAVLTEGKRIEAGPPGNAAAIRRKYGEWIVESREFPLSGRGQQLAPLSSIEDLVKVADELGKPILHSKKSGKDLYFVYDGQLVYSYPAE